MTGNMVRVATEAMATRFEIAIWDERDEVQLRAIAEHAVEVIQYWHARLNLFDQASLCGHIARMEPGMTLRLDADEAKLINACLEWWKISAGAYDSVVSGARKRSVEPSGSSADMQLSGDNTLTVKRSGLLLDFGSVAKGFALDMARQVMLDEGVMCAFGHGGTSSVMTIGVPRDQPNWKVRVGELTVELDGSTAACLSVSKPMQGAARHIADARGTAEIADAQMIVAVTHASGLCSEGWSTLLLIDPSRRKDYDTMIDTRGGLVMYARAM